jgi:hypothetical protein
MKGMVYFAACSGRIKIGTSVAPEARIREIATHLFDAVTLLAVARGGAELESAIHKRLNKHLLRNEWFVDCEEVRAVMGDVVDRGPIALGELYKPKNRARFASLYPQDVCLKYGGNNSWDVLLQRVDDLALQAKHFENGDQAARLLNRARGYIIIWCRAARAVADDQKAMDKAAALVERTSGAVNRIIGIELPGHFTAKRWGRMRGDGSVGGMSVQRALERLRTADRSKGPIPAREISWRRLSTRPPQLAR